MGFPLSQITITCNIFVVVFLFFCPPHFIFPAALDVRPSWNCGVGVTWPEPFLVNISRWSRQRDCFKGVCVRPRACDWMVVYCINAMFLHSRVPKVLFVIGTFKSCVLNSGRKVKNISTTAYLSLHPSSVPYLKCYEYEYRYCRNINIYTILYMLYKLRSLERKSDWASLSFLKTFDLSYKKLL